MVVTKSRAKIGIVKGSGNVFADLGLPDAEERKTKVRLVVAINDLIARATRVFVTAA